MADIKEMRIFCAEQIVVPDDLPALLKNYSKEVIRANPQNIYAFSARYFENLLKEQGKNIDTIKRPEPSGIPTGASSRPAAASSGDRKISYFNPDTENTINLASPPANFDDLLSAIGESRGIFTYNHQGDDSFIHDQESYDQAWANCGNDLQIQEKTRMRV